MNITVFGGTGETGLLLIQKALAAGHRVTAFARNPAKFSFQHDNLSIVQGNLDEPDNIDKAVSGADAVISILGPTGKTKGLLISNGLKNIIAAMEKNGVQRLIATTTPSYPDPKDRFQFGFAFGVWMVKTLLKDTYRDIVATGTVVANSKLDWTLVRLPMLSNQPASGNLNIGYTGDGKVKLFSLSRADLADFLLKQLEAKTYLRQAPVISN